MDFLQAVTDRIPDFAKDVRLNLGAVIGRSSLEPADALGVAVAAAYAANCQPLIEAIRGSGQLPEAEVNASLTAAALMGMNNVWYPYVEMAQDDELAKLRPELRMNAYANHGGTDKRRFELYALAASIVGKCHFCVASHYKLLTQNGMTTQQLRDVGRIAAVVNAAAQALRVGA